jgi:hypothetical protein
VCCGLSTGREHIGCAGGVQGGVIRRKQFARGRSRPRRHAAERGTAGAAASEEAGRKNGHGGALTSRAAPKRHNPPSASLQQLPRPSCGLLTICRLLCLRMKLVSALPQGARRWWVVCAVAACAAAAAVAYALAAGGSSGASAQAGGITTESPAAFRAAVVGHLRARHLDYRWVVCVRTDHRFAGVRVVRCNVDFGEPHIQAYCSVLRRGRLLTSEQDPAIPCGHDNAGYSDPVIQYG